MPLSVEEEQRFQQDYARLAEMLGLSPDPDDPRHFYDYRAAWKSGELKAGEELHFPSKFKMPGHPRRFIDGVDTITGRRATPKEIQQNEQIRRRIEGSVGIDLFPGERRPQLNRAPGGGPFRVGVASRLTQNPVPVFQREDVLSAMADILRSQQPPRHSDFDSMNMGDIAKTIKRAQGSRP